MCSFEFVLCAVVSLSYVQFLAFVMCRFLVCVVCSLQSRPSSLRSEHASLRSVGRVYMEESVWLLRNPLGCDTLALSGQLIR